MSRDHRCGHRRIRARRGRHAAGHQVTVAAAHGENAVEVAEQVDGTAAATAPDAAQGNGWTWQSGGRLTGPTV